MYKDARLGARGRDIKNITVYYLIILIVFDLGEYGFNFKCSA